MVKLDNIPQELQSSIEKKGYKKLTNVQKLVLNYDLKDQDLLVSSQTGSGKTLAYGLSVYNHCLKTMKLNNKKLTALIITPTRELAMQVFNEFSWLFSKKSIKMSTAIGGMDIKREKNNFSKGINLLIGTPGRLNDHLRRKSIILNQLKSLVLDEADEMLDLGFKQDLEEIIKQTSKETRIMMFSATIPNKIERLANKYQKNPVRIEATNLNKAHSDIFYETYFIKKHDIENAIFNFIRYHDDKTILIFCSTRNAVNHIYTRILNRGFSAVSLSGAFSQNERFKALQSIKNNRCKICVATDVAARGIDLINLDIVIHADLPQNSEILIHRSGRTGRAGQKGRSILFCSPNDKQKYERLINKAKIEPVISNFPTSKDIELRDNKKIIDILDFYKGKNPEESNLAKDLLDNFSPLDISLGLIGILKEKNSPIEEVESFDKEFIDNIDIYKMSKKRNKRIRKKRKKRVFKK